MNPQAATTDGTYDIRFMPFMAATTEEQKLEEVIRLMLYSHIIKTRIERDALEEQPMTQAQRQLAHVHARQARVTGFRLEHAAVKEGVRVYYDDEMLRQEAVRFSYLMSAGHVEEAIALEEEVVTIAVAKSLYGTRPETMAIAA